MLNKVFMSQIVKIEHGSKTILDQQNLLIANNREHLPRINTSIGNKNKPYLSHGSKEMEFYRYS